MIIQGINNPIGFGMSNNEVTIWHLNATTS